MSDFGSKSPRLRNLRSPAASMGMSGDVVNFSLRMLNRSILCSPHARFSIVGNSPQFIDSGAHQKWARRVRRLSTDFLWRRPRTRRLPNHAHCVCNEEWLAQRRVEYLRSAEEWAADLRIDRKVAARFGVAEI